MLLLVLLLLGHVTLCLTQLLVELLLEPLQIKKKPRQSETSPPLTLASPPPQTNPKLLGVGLHLLIVGLCL